MECLRRELVKEVVEQGQVTRYYNVLTTETSFQVNYSEAADGAEAVEAAREGIEARVAAAHVLPEVASLEGEDA